MRSNPGIEFGESMSTRQVFIIWTHPLFQESIALLMHHPEIELVGETDDHDSASKQIVIENNKGVLDPANPTLPGSQPIE
jgi:hypothetical protein